MVESGYDNLAITYSGTFDRKNKLKMRTNL